MVGLKGNSNIHLALDTSAKGTLDVIRWIPQINIHATEHPSQYHQVRVDEMLDLLPRTMVGLTQALTSRIDGGHLVATFS